MRGLPGLGLVTAASVSERLPKKPVCPPGLTGKQYPGKARAEMKKELLEEARNDLIIKAQTCSALESHHHS